MKLILLYYCIFFCLVVFTKGKEVTISNIMARVDGNGIIVNSHDGSIQQFTINNSTRYYVHAMEYGLCTEPIPTGCDSTPDHCGFQLDHNISIWSTPDFSPGSWVYEGNAIDVNDRPVGVVFRAHLVYNPNTKLYVLWWNYDNNNLALLAVATGPTPTGPFKLVNDRVNVTQSGESGDYTLFVDDDGTGYIVYSMNYVMHIEQLTPDFVYSSGSAGKDFEEYFVEAPVMFKRNGIYYVLFGHCCCYCEQGSGIIVHTATSPLGPYSTQAGDQACTVPFNASIVPSPPDPRHFTPGQGCQYANPQLTSVVRAQQNYVIEVNTPTGIEYIWTGDRWQQAPDSIKGHEPQYWVPMQFNEDGSLQNFTWVDSFTIDVI